MCNYPEESYSGHADEKRVPPQQSPELKKTNEAIDKCVDDLMETSNVDISLMMDDYKESLAESDAKRQEGADFLGIRLTEEEAKANGDLQLKFCGFVKEIEAEKAKCPMAEAEDQDLEDMCSARRIIPDEQPTGGQHIDTQFSDQEESVIMAEVDKRVAEISNQLQAEYADKVQKRTDELDKKCREYLAKKEKQLVEKEKELVDHVDKKSNEYYKQLIEEQRQSLNAYYTALWSCWNFIPDDMKAKFGGTEYVKKYATRAENELNHAHLEQELNYDADSLVERIGEKYKKNGHISDEDLSTLASDSSMLSNFILHYVPMADRCKFELTLQALKEQHPEMQWNVQALNIEDGGTFNFSGLPNMSDTVMSSNNDKVCTVGDIYEAQLKHYKEANEAMKLGKAFDPKNVDWKWQQNKGEEKVAMQCSKTEVDAISANQPAVRMLTDDIVKDLPKSMVDKITSISNEYWSHQYRDHWFDLLYKYSTRYILISVNFNALAADDKVNMFLSLEYKNTGIGSLDYAMKFKKLDDLLACGPNGRRFYEWLTVVVDAFFNK